MPHRQCWLEGRRASPLARTAKVRMPAMAAAWISPQGTRDHARPEPVLLPGRSSRRGGARIVIGDGMPREPLDKPPRRVVVGDRRRWPAKGTRRPHPRPARYGRAPRPVELASAEPAQESGRGLGARNRTARRDGRAEASRSGAARSLALWADRILRPAPCQLESQVSFEHAAQRPASMPRRKAFHRAACEPCRPCPLDDWVSLGLARGLFELRTRAPVGLRLGSAAAGIVCFGSGVRRMSSFARASGETSRRGRSSPAFEERSTTARHCHDKA